MITVSKGPISEAEYLAMEEQSQVRHELYHGNLIEMPGGTIYHETVVMNIAFILKTFFEKAGFKVFATGLKLKLASDKYFYPDILLTNEIFQNKLYSTEPIFLIEVLSPATRTFDMVDKFIAYRTISSLEYYLLVEPEYYHATLHFKSADGTWQSETYRKLTEEIKLPKLDISLPLSAIYKGLEWD
jgi:Uma2 family endonuclease